MDYEYYQSSPEPAAASPNSAIHPELSTCEGSSPSVKAYGYCIASVGRVLTESSQNKPKSAPKSPADQHPRVNELVESIRKKGAIWQPMTVLDDSPATQMNKCDLLDARAYEDSLRRATEPEFIPQKSLDERKFVEEFTAMSAKHFAKYSHEKKPSKACPIVKTPSRSSGSCNVRQSPRKKISPCKFWIGERATYLMECLPGSNIPLSNLIGYSLAKPEEVTDCKRSISRAKKSLKRFLKLDTGNNLETTSFKPLKSSRSVSVQTCSELEVQPQNRSSGAIFGKVHFEPNAMEFGEYTDMTRFDQFDMKTKEPGQWPQNELTDD